MNSAATRTSPKLYNCLLSWNPLAWSKINFSPSAPSMSKTLGVLPFFWGAAFPLGGCLSFGGCLLSLTLPLTLTIPFSLFASLRLLFLFIRFAKPREVQGTAKNDYHKKFGAKFWITNFTTGGRRHSWKKNNWITQRKTSSVKEKFNQGKKLKYSRNSSTEEQFSQGILHSRNSSVNVKSIREQCGQGILQSKNNSVRHTSVNKV